LNLRGTLSEKISRLLFAAVQGRRLIYNTCWEDPAVDRAALDLQPDDRVLVITSAGCNALDYLLAGAGQVHAVDVNPCQNALLEFKVAAIRRLDFSSFFELFGKGRSSRAGQMYHDAVRPLLSAGARQFWDVHLGYFRGKGWRDSFYYRGTFGLLARLQLANAQQLLRLRGAINKLLATTDIHVQEKIYRTEVHGRLWTPLTNWLCSRQSLLSLIGIPWEQRRLINEYPGGILQFSRDIVEAVFTRLPLKTNYFWRVYLQGHYDLDCCPEYLRPENYARLRGELLERLTINTLSVTNFLERAGPTISKFVLLDHMDWMNAHDRRGLAAEWTALLTRARSGARVIFRSAGLHVSYLDMLSVSYRGRQALLGDLLQFDRSHAQELHTQDRVHMYGSFHIAQLP
jgi:S-adenosylmethionine-diacylglycerol 3-amino-3-carboxypropyl transferase